MIYYLEEALALAYGIVASPSRTMPVIAGGQRLYEGFIVWAASVLLSVLSVCVQWEDAALWTVVAMYGGAAVFLGIRAVFLHASSRLLGGRGSVKSLLAALCFAEIPLNLATLAGSFVFAAPPLLVQTVSLLALLWTLVLDVMALQAVYGMSAGRSAAALVLPVLAAAGLLVVLVLYLIVSLASLLS